MTKKSTTWLPVIATFFIVLIGLLWATKSRADISNPHPTPPSNSVTNAMLTSTAVTDGVVSTSAAINLSKLSQTGDSSFIPFGTGSGLGTSSKLFFTSGTNTFNSTGSTTLGATTTINGVQYVWTGSQATANYVLQNDGSGNLSWQSKSPTKTLLAYTAYSAINQGSTTAIISTPANTIAFDTSANGSVSSSGANTVSFTVANNSNRILVVELVARNQTTVTVSGVTYNGVSMTQDLDSGAGTSGHAYEYSLVAPATGANNVVITLSGAGGYDYFVYSLYNAAQSGQPADKTSTTADNNGNYLTPSVNFAVGVCAGYGGNFSGGTCWNQHTSSDGTYASSGMSAFQTWASALGISGASPAGSAVFVDIAPFTASGATYQALPAHDASQANASTTIGIADNTVAAAGTVNVVVSGLATNGLVGLTNGSTYFMSSTDGWISTTPDTVSFKIGKAVGTTGILVNIQQ